MAEPLSKSIVTLMSQRGLLLLCLCLAISLAHSHTLTDPTQPPAAFDRGQGAAAVITGPMLQSVLIASGRSEAIISGQTVRLGEKFGDAQVIKIADTEVVLRNGKDLQTLRLFPSIEKRPTYSHAGTKSGGRVQEK
jgi:MSHA biogenesis protein MshK